MKLHPMLHHKITCSVLLTAAGLLFSAQTEIQAQSFTYTNCDLVAGFRLIGGASDLVVDLGQVANFESLAPRSVITVSNLEITQLNDALPTLDGVSWSVAAALRGNTNYSDPLQTLWVTSPRPAINTPGKVWVCESEWTLGGTASQIDAIGYDASVYGNGQPAGPDNTATGILIPPSSQYAYSALMGSLGNYDGTFQGPVENTTPSDFDSAGLPSRSVLYKLLPAASGAAKTPGTIIGFFDFTPAGTLTFTAGPPPEQTKVSGISLNGTVATIQFSTINLVGYRLRYTNSSGLSTPVSTWTIGSALIGNGSTLSLQDTNSDPIRFYTVEAYY
jgi:hypothetical protein